MKQAFRSKAFRYESEKRIEQANEILDEYDQKLTARQLYYQFVSRGIIPNTPTSYKNLTSLLTDARYAGLLDWDKIEDRGREPDKQPQFDDLEDLMEAAFSSYRLPRWLGQKSYVELWVEKQALAGVLAPIARRHHVTLMVNKGYSSASAMYESAQRFRDNCVDDMASLVKAEDAVFARAEDVCSQDACADDAYSREEVLAQMKTIFGFFKRQPLLFYLGDHDPSGEDMVRDITDRLREFRVWPIEVVKLGLTMAQVKTFNPPPNPAKITDSRAKAYIEKFGEYSWEVDALPPRELNRIIDIAFGAIIDNDKMNAVIAKEETDKKLLRKALGNLRSK